MWARRTAPRYALEPYTMILSILNGRAKGIRTTITSSQCSLTYFTRRGATATLTARSVAKSAQMSMSRAKATASDDGLRSQKSGAARSGTIAKARIISGSSVIRSILSSMAWRRSIFVCVRLACLFTFLSPFRSGSAALGAATVRPSRSLNGSPESEAPIQPRSP